jgi:hypothetical protein
MENIEDLKKGVETKFTKIVVLVEMKDGSLRQILAPMAQKTVAVSLLANEDGNIVVSEKIEPIEFKFIPNE